MCGKTQVGSSGPFLLSTWAVQSFPVLSSRVVKAVSLALSAVVGSSGPFRYWPKRAVGWYFPSCFWKPTQSWIRFGQAHT